MTPEQKIAAVTEEFRRGRLIIFMWGSVAMIVAALGMRFHFNKEQWFLLFAAIALTVTGMHLLYGPRYRKSDLKFPWEE